MVDNITDEAILDAAHELRRKAIEKAKDERDDNRPSASMTQWTGRGPGPSDEYIEEQAEWIVDAFRKYLKPFPRDFDPIIEKMKSVEAAFGEEDDSFGNPDLGMIEVSANYLAQWEGALAISLRENFLGPFPVIAANHGKLASYLRLHMQMMKSIYESGRQDALDIAEKGQEAIDAITDCKGSDLKILLAVLIAAGTLMGPVLGAAQAALSAQLFNASIIAGSVLGGPFVKEGPTVPLGGDTVEEVMDNVREALNKIGERLAEEEGHLLEALKKTQGEVSDVVSLNMEEATPLLLMPPKIITDPGDYTKGLVQFSEEDGQDGGGGGRGSYVGDDPPDNWDGAIHDTGGDS
ncbi:hypothetical protein LX16_1349 [Stackebrandtia albiflava]|uniref:Uncharacterized protein n=1 Tax=Stackebrandtia albiflava TaxID=406432 RepID=A0A562VCR3_9ACTN|nr:hypothetical protein [Stackebrandtia albiflava]TWJ15638.1 hypothetical protein LX16_1349 [Stackebrandtia albiflava]